jgi:hypothetical protein
MGGHAWCGIISSRTFHTIDDSGRAAFSLPQPYPFYYVHSYFNDIGFSRLNPSVDNQESKSGWPPHPDTGTKAGDDHTKKTFAIFSSIFGRKVWAKLAAK